MQVIKCVVVGDGYERERKRKIVNFAHNSQIIF